MKINTGERIQKTREEAGLSVLSLAQKCAMRPAYLQQIEDGIVEAHIRTYQKIADALGVRVQFIIGEDSEPGGKKLSDELSGRTLWCVQATVKLVMVLGTIFLICALVAAASTLLWLGYSHFELPSIERLNEGQLYTKNVGPLALSILANP